MSTKKINGIIRHLSKPEQAIVAYYLDTIKPFGYHKNNEYKEKLLFKYLTSNNTNYVSDADLSRLLNTKRIDMLKSNLFEKIVEALVFDKYIGNSSVFDKHDSTVFKLKKEMLAIRILYRNSTKNKSEYLFNWLENLIKNAKNNEVYDVVTEGLLLKKYIYGLRKGLKEFEKINSEIEHYRFCNSALYNATDDYTRFILNNDFLKVYSENEIKRILNESIDRLENDFNITQSQQINYFLQILKLAKFDKDNNYESAIDLCKKIIILLKKNTIIYRNERIGFINDHLSQFLVYSGDYKKASHAAAKAQSYYIENSFYSLVSKEQEFYAHFYDSNFYKANICINFLLNHPLSDSGEFRKSKFIYYKTCILFQQQDYTACWKLLKNNLEVEKDKTRWNLSIRILMVLLFIELKKTDEAARAIDALKKQMYRLKSENEINKRDLIILECLKIIEKEGFIVDKKNQKLMKLYKELSKKNSIVSWKHYSHELVKFHKWIEKRLIVKTPGNT